MKQVRYPNIVIQRASSRKEIMGSQTILITASLLVQVSLIIPSFFPVIVASFVLFIKLLQIEIL